MNKQSKKATKTKEEVNQEVNKMSEKSVEVKKEEKTKEKSVKSQIAENVRAKKRQEELRESLKRGTFESSGRLTVDKSKEDKDYVYRIVNDQPGKIDRAINLGYEFVTDSSPTNYQEIDNPTGQGAKKQFEVGKYRGSVKAYYMRCPKDIYDARKTADREDEQKRFKNAVSENQREDQRKE